MKKLEEQIAELTKAHEKSSKEDVIKALAESLIAKEEVEGDVDEINKKLSDFESGKVKKLPKPTVKVGNTTYEIVSPQVKVKGELISAAEIKENKKVIRHKGDKDKDVETKVADYLVNIGSGVLSPKSK